MNCLSSLPKGHFLFTSESVTVGHPDKMCDYISDSILDACIEKDPNSKVACEACCKNSFAMAFGEITTNANICYEQVIRQAIKEIGYNNINLGFDYKNAQIMINLDQQSQEIAVSVHKNKTDEELGAGDQGLMMGYATNETEELMPFSHLYANKLVQRMQECRRSNICTWMRPDGKVQITVEYSNINHQLKPVRVHTVLISCQHNPDVSLQTIQKDLKELVIFQVIPKQYLDDKTIYHLNPSGSFVLGGPHGDSGLTGRKIIVDTYGGWGGHGGGAFSGKDPTKVDRSATYAARWIAKSLVHNKFCERCFVQVSYGIGISHPLSIFVDSYNTCAKGYTDQDLVNIIQQNFDLRPGMIIKNLNLKRPIYKKTASLGHFGRNDEDFTWEHPKDLSHCKIQKK